MSKTLVIGDLHLGRGIKIGKPGIGTELNSRISDQFTLLEWVYDQAIENNVDRIIFTGDICEDVKPDYILIVYFIQWLKKCDVNNIIIDIVAGNHDLKRSGSHYISVLDIIQSAEVSNVFIHKQIDTIYNGPVGFTLLPFRDRRSFNLDSTSEALIKIKDLLVYEVSEIPLTYTKILIGHLAIEGSLWVGDEIDDTINELMCPIEMFNKFDFTWMGHVHRPQVRSDSPYVAHIGSLDISDFGETDHQKIIILFDSMFPTKFQEIKVPSRPLRRIRLIVPSGIDTTQSILDEIEKIEKNISFKNALVKLEISLIGKEAINADREKIEKIIYQYGAFYISNFSESRTITVVPVEKQTQLENTIEPKMAVKMYAEHLSFDSDDNKNLFITMCNKIIENYGKS